MERSIRAARRGRIGRAARAGAALALAALGLASAPGAPAAEPTVILISLDGTPPRAIHESGLSTLPELARRGAEADALLPGGRLPETSNPFGHPGLEAVAATAWATARARCEAGVVMQYERRWREAADAYRTCARLAPHNAWAGEALSRAEDLAPTAP